MRVVLACVRFACDVHAHAHAVRGPHAMLRTHARTHARKCPHTRAHLRHVGELGARPVARVREHVVEWLVAAVLQGVDVH